MRKLGSEARQHKNSDSKEAEVTSDDPVDGLFKVFPVDGRLQVSGGDQSRLVADVGDVSA